MPDAFRPFSSFPGVMGPFGHAIRRTQEDPLAPYGPTTEAVEAERQLQESNKGFSVWDILDIPTKAMFGYAITGAMAPEAGETAWQGFNRGAPWSFLIDALGLSEAVFGEKDYVRRKGMRDIRIAHGALPEEVDDGLGSFVLNTLGDIVLDPSSFALPFGKIPGAAKGMVKEAVRQSGKLVDVLRPAVTIEEKVRTHMNGMLVFKVPWMDAGFDATGWLPENIRVWSAERLSKSAAWLRRNAVTGAIYRQVNAATGGIANTFARVGVKDAFEKGREARNAIYFEGIDRLKSLYKRIGHKFDADGHKAIIDFLEHDIDQLDDAASIGRKFERGYLFQQNAARIRKLVKADPVRFSDLQTRAVAGDLDAITELYEAGVPQSLSRLKLAGLDVRPGIDIPGPSKSGPSLGAHIEKIGQDMGALDPLGGAPTTAVGQASRRIPESAADLQAAPMPTDEILAKAGAERQARLGRVTGKDAYTLDDLKTYAMGLKGIYQDLASAEMRAGLLNDALELYVPRQIHPKARDLLHLEFKKLIQRRHGERGLGIWAEHLNGRKFDQLSTLEVNLLVSDLGSKITGYTPLEAMADLASDKEFQKALRRGGAGDVLDFFNTDTTAVTYRRLSEGARVVGRRAMLNHMLDPQNGVVTHVSDSSDLAGNLTMLRQVGTDGLELVPIVDASKGHGLSFLDKSEVIEGALVPHQRGRVLAAQTRYMQEINDWITIDGARYTAARDQLMKARDLKGGGPNVLAQAKGGPGGPGDLQVTVDKKNLIRQKQEIADEIRVAKLRRPKTPSGLVARRSFALDPAGTLTFKGDASALTPGQRALVDDYIAEADLISRSHTGTPDELKQYLKDLRVEADVALKEALDEDLSVLVMRRKKNREALTEVDASIKGMLDHEFFRHDTQVAAYRDVIQAGVRHGLADVRKALAEGKGRDIVDELQIFRDSDYATGLKQLAPDELQAVGKFKGRKVYWMERSTAEGVLGALQAIHAPDYFGKLGRMLDHFPNWWKRTTVLPWPQSRVRDVVSNLSLLLMGGMRHGISATQDTFDLLSRHKRMLNEGLSEDEAFKGALYKIRDKAGNAVNISGVEALKHLRQKGLLDSGYVADELMQSMDETVRLYAPQSGKEAAKDWVDVLDLRQLVKGGPTRSGLVKLGMKVSAGADNYTKVIGYMDALKRGMDPDEAADHVRKFLWNPAHAYYSRAERYALRRLIPFYTWSKFAVGLMTEQFLSRPGVVNFWDKIQKNMRTNPALTFDSEGEPVGDADEDILAARAINQRMGVPWRMTKHGPEYFLFDGYIPHAEIPQFANMFLGASKVVLNALPGVDIKQGPGGDEAISWWAERLTPAIKVPLELARNESFYTQQDIEYYAGEQGTMLGVPMTKKQQHLFEQVRLLREVNTLLRGQSVRTLRADIEASKIDDPRTFWTKLLSSGFGPAPRVRPINLERAINRAEVEAQTERGKLRARLRDNIETPDRGQVDENNREAIVEEMTRVQANLLRIEDLRNRFKIEKEKRKRFQPITPGGR